MLCVSFLFCRIALVYPRARSPRHEDFNKAVQLTMTCIVGGKELLANPTTPECMDLEKYSKECNTINIRTTNIIHHSSSFALSSITYSFLSLFAVSFLSLLSCSCLRCCPLQQTLLFQTRTREDREKTR
jgi:hypothetical protein